jgi:hypothetical protein
METKSRPINLHSIKPAGKRMTFVGLCAPALAHPVEAAVFDCQAKINAQGLVNAITSVRGRVAFVTTLLAMLMLLLLSPAGARAASFTVTDFKDGGYAGYLCTNPQYKDHSCTLRAAIIASNANGQENTIYLPRDYKLDAALPPITSPRWLTIQGTGAGLPSISGSCTEDDQDPSTNECPHLDPANEFSVLRVAPTGALWLIGVTIKNGQTGHGAGIYNEGSLMVYTSTVKRNHAHFYGAGIYNKGWTYLQDATILNNAGHRGGGGGLFNFSGTTEIAYSTISGNRTNGGVGAGIFNYEGVVTLSNSTVSGNFSRNEQIENPDAGGILNYADGEVWLKNVTITANTVPYGPGVNQAGGVLNRGTFFFSNTIIARNKAATYASDCDGPMSTLGGNLIGTTNACTLVPRHDWDPPSRPRAGDRNGTGLSAVLDPLLGPLADNGGNSCTHALDPASPAINKGWQGKPDEHPLACEKYDQRWSTRISATNGGYNCDIGAFELTGRQPLLGLNCTE